MGLNLVFRKSHNIFGFDSEKVMTFLENESFLVLLHHGRQNDSRTAAPVYGKHQEQEHEAGGDCAEIPFRSRLPFPHQCKAITRYARYCVEEIPHLHLRERMLLARSRGMPSLCLAENQYRFLEGENPAEPRAGLGSSHQASRHGVARHSVLGMSAQTEGEGGESARIALHLK